MKNKIDYNKTYYSINMDISVREGNDRKSYYFNTEYQGDIKKLDPGVMLDGWFVENNIDKSGMSSCSINIYKCEPSDMMMAY